MFEDTGRILTEDERLLLVQNTERLSAQFEIEYQLTLERVRLQVQKAQGQGQRVQARDQVVQTKIASRQQSMPTATELASVEHEAKRIVRQIWCGPGCTRLARPRDGMPARAAWPVTC